MKLYKQEPENAQRGQTVAYVEATEDEIRAVALMSYMAELASETDPASWGPMIAALRENPPWGGKHDKG